MLISTRRTTHCTKKVLENLSGQENKVTLLWESALDFKTRSNRKSHAFMGRGFSNGEIQA